MALGVMRRARWGGDVGTKLLVLDFDDTRILRFMRADPRPVLAGCGHSAGSSFASLNTVCSEAQLSQNL